MTNPIASTGGPAPAPTARQPIGFDRDMFLKLLIAQMRYQDPSKPIDGSELLAQSAAMSTVEMLEAVRDSQASLLAYQTVTFGSSLIGKTVKANGLDGLPVTGTVTAAKVVNGNAFVVVGDKTVPVINVIEVS